MLLQLSCLKTHGRSLRWCAAPQLVYFFIVFDDDALRAGACGVPVAVRVLVCIEENTFACLQRNRFSVVVDVRRDLPLVSSHSFEPFDHPKTSNVRNQPPTAIGGRFERTPCV